MNSMSGKWNYFRRIFKVYLTRDKGYLSFWHEEPAVSDGINTKELGPYYMTFADKANYDGPKDDNGIILFDYYFDIGRQYNPLAVAQYGLGHWNLYIKTGDKKHLRVAKTQADWLVDNLEQNEQGLWVWKHKFKWHYKQNLEPGWYSAHSQGTGISLLGRMYKETGEEKYLKTAGNAFVSLAKNIEDGGVEYVDNEGNTWLEEYLIESPTHILNGFLWALWGVWDFLLIVRYAREQKILSNFSRAVYSERSQTKSREVEGLPHEEEVLNLWNACIKTLEKNLHRYDVGFWSLYDLSKQKMKMIASPFYHKLHIVQLKVTHILSGEEAFKKYADKFAGYESKRSLRILAFVYKAIFKLFYF